MTRKKWSDLREEHLRSPEDRARYELARTELEAELAEALDIVAGLADVKARAQDDA